MSGASWRAWRVRAKASIAYGNGRRLCFWLRTAWRRGRLHAGWAVPPGRQANGGFAMRPTGLPGWTKPAIAVRCPNTPPRPAGAFWRFSTARRQPVMAAWTAPLIATALGDVHEQYVWRFLRAQKIDLAGRKSWCVSHDPEFAAKAAEIVGLYLDPPEGALVVAVDEKPHIQALERVQGYLRLPNGRAVSGRAHDYMRHGTSTLIAAFNIANGEVTARHYKRRRRIEFLDFMNRVVAGHRGREIHVILDNLKTHKPKRDGWLARHKNVHFHFTPTHASWLNQVECWFSPANPCKEQASLASLSSGNTSMRSSSATTKPPVPSPGANPKSIRNVSNRVSRTSDSGY